MTSQTSQRSNGISKQNQTPPAATESKQSSVKIVYVVKIVGPHNRKFRIEKAFSSYEKARDYVLAAKKGARNTIFDITALDIDDMEAETEK